jgi:hypothetical protein
MLMKEAGLENVFGHVTCNWKCVNESDVIAAAPDVFVVVDAAWDTAMSKISWIYNHPSFCNMDVVQGARLVQIPFSATTLSPRNGPAALDLAIASLHVRTGSHTAVRESGVKSPNAATFKSHIQGLKCTLDKSKVKWEVITDGTTTTTIAPGTTTTTIAPTTIVQVTVDIKVKGLDYDVLVANETAKLTFKNGIIVRTALETGVTKEKIEVALSKGSVIAKVSIKTTVDKQDALKATVTQKSSKLETAVVAVAQTLPAAVKDGSEITAQASTPVILATTTTTASTTKTSIQETSGCPNGIALFWTCVLALHVAHQALF